MKKLILLFIFINSCSLSRIDKDYSGIVEEFEFSRSIFEIHLTNGNCFAVMAGNANLFQKQQLENKISKGDSIFIKNGSPDSLFLFKKTETLKYKIDRKYNFVCH